MANEHRVVTGVCNIDIDSAIRRINRSIVEVIKSQSSGLSYTLTHDDRRWRHQLAALRAFLARAVTAPILDCPETGPTAIEVDKNPEVPRLENESAFDLVAILEIMRDEIGNSQSARLPSSLMQFDYDRAMSYIDKAEQLLDYVMAQEPLDLPESSPMHEMTGPGRTGV